MREAINLQFHPSCRPQMSRIHGCLSCRRLEHWALTLLVVISLRLLLRSAPQSSFVLVLPSIFSSPLLYCSLRLSILSLSRSFPTVEVVVGCVWNSASSPPPVCVSCMLTVTSSAPVLSLLLFQFFILFHTVLFFSLFSVFPTLLRSWGWSLSLSSLRHLQRHTNGNGSASFVFALSVFVQHRTHGDIIMQSVLSLPL